MVKAVLVAIPTHQFIVLAPPKRILTFLRKYREDSLRQDALKPMVATVM
jgi:hypothetical protein